MRYSPFPGIICLLLSLPGCFSGTGPHREREQAALRAETLVRQYGERSSGPAAEYLAGLSERLSQALSARPGRLEPGETFSIRLLDTSQALAVSPGRGQIVLSRGMIIRLMNESELAFVIAHEMGHQALGHSEEEDIDADLEMAADRYALGIVALAGYDPRFAAGSIPHAYGAVPPESAAHYPAPEKRVQALMEALAESGWQPPGTINRRAFVEFRQALAG